MMRVISSPSISTTGFLTLILLMGLVRFLGWGKKGVRLGPDGGTIGNYNKRPSSPLARLILLNKPFGVLCQFSREGGHPTLKDFLPVPGVYPAGRLDTDSEGLVVLTDDGRLQAAIADPRHKLEKVYWVQVEGTPSPDALEALRRGVALRDGPTRPAGARAIAEPPGLWPRVPPIRERRAIPTAWLELRLREGRNRQ